MYDPEFTNAIYGLNTSAARGPEFLQTGQRSASSRIALNTGTACV
jgi:hypothetical protein